MADQSEWRLAWPAVSEGVTMTSKICECCGQVLPEHWDVVAAKARLSPKQTELFLAVAAGRGNCVPWEVLENAVYGQDLDGGPLSMRNTLFVTAGNANARLTKAGYQMKGGGKGVRQAGLRLVTL